MFVSLETMTSETDEPIREKQPAFFSLVSNSGNKYVNAYNDIKLMKTPDLEADDTNLKEKATTIIATGQENVISYCDYGDNLRFDNDTLDNLKKTFVETSNIGSPIQIVDEQFLPETGCNYDGCKKSSKKYKNESVVIEEHVTITHSEFNNLNKTMTDNDDILVEPIEPGEAELLDKCFYREEDIILKPKGHEADIESGDEEGNDNKEFGLVMSSVNLQPIKDGDVTAEEEYVSPAETPLADAQVTDITEDDMFDTDLDNVEEAIKPQRIKFDATGVSLYVETCKKCGVVPVSYFIRHMQDEKVIMKHHGLGPMGAKAIAVPLIFNTTVLTLDLEDNWLEGLGGQYIAEMLKENIYITDLNLAHNHLGSSGASVMVEMFQTNASLKRVNLAGNDFKDRDAEHIAYAIVENLRIHWLDLSHNEFSDTSGDILSHAIAENESLDYLDLSWNHFRGKSAIKIMEGLKVNIKIRTFKFAFNGLSNGGMAAVSECLSQNANLEELDISSNRIQTMGAGILAKGLGASESLRIIRLANNPIQSAGAMPLLLAVNNPAGLVVFMDITGNQVTKQFDILHKEILQSRQLTILHSGILSNYTVVGTRKKGTINGTVGQGDSDLLDQFLKNDPMAILKTHMEKKHLRLLDLFNQFDKDKNHKISVEEFKKGVVAADVGLTEEQVDALMKRLDSMCVDGMIDYSEMVEGSRKVTMEARRLKKLSVAYGYAK